MADLTKGVGKAIKTYWKNNKKRAPELIIIYRDGVSEGQINSVRRFEIP